MNRRAKFDAASFILGGEIRNRTKVTHKQIVNDISTHAEYPTMHHESLWYNDNECLGLITQRQRWRVMVGL